MLFHITYGLRNVQQNTSNFPPLPLGYFHIFYLCTAISSLTHCHYFYSKHSNMESKVAKMSSVFIHVFFLLVLLMNLCTLIIKLATLGLQMATFPIRVVGCDSWLQCLTSFPPMQTLGVRTEVLGFLLCLQQVRTVIPSLSFHPGPVLFLQASGESVSRDMNSFFAS